MRMLAGAFAALLPLAAAADGSAPQPLAEPAAAPVAAPATAAGTGALSPVKLRYEVDWGGMSLGEMVITLEPEGGAGCYRYRSVSKPIGLVRMFYGAPSETSEFCVVNGRVVPRRFEFSHPKNAAESFTLEFDTPGKVVKSSRGDVRPLPENAQDRFGLHQAVRLWLMQAAGRENPGEAEFTLVDEDRARVYRFGLTGRTRLRTAAGTFDTLVVERINDKRKVTRFWIAPDAGYMPVQVERIKDGKVQFRMVLEP